MQSSLIRRLLALPLIAVLVVSGIAVQTAAAGIVGTETALEQPVGSEQQRLIGLLEREDVQEQLVARGVDPEHAAERAASLSNAEAAELTAQIDALPAGGNAVVLLLVIILLLLVLR